MVNTSVGVIECKKCPDDILENIIKDIENHVRLRVISSKNKVPFSVVNTIYKKYISLSYSVKNKSLNNTETEMKEEKVEKESTPLEISNPVKEDKSMNRSNNVRSNKQKKNTTSHSNRTHGGKGKKFGESDNKKKEGSHSKSKKPQKKNVIKQTKDNEESANIVSCGLIKDRHDMPVKKFIFNEIQESIMFKYEELDKIVEDFVKKEIPFKKDDETGELVGAKTLKVYVTGLSCCTGSVIKICNKLKVNLILMHHNNRNGLYFEQVILDDFGKGYEKRLFPTATTVNMHDINIEYMKKNSFFVIRTVKLYKEDKNIINFDIFKDQKKLWIYHGKLLSEEMTSENNVCVYVDLCRIEKGKENKDFVKSINKISSIYNTDTNDKK